MDDLGYKPIFDKAIEISEKVNYQEAIPNFRNHPELFHFIMAAPYMYDPDILSLNQARDIDISIYGSLMSKGPSKAGAIHNSIDTVESRHILMMTFLIKSIGTDWGEVLEIGGGYGNCLRLISGLVKYTKWSILDLSYILDLQKWFLQEENVDLSRVEFLSTQKT